jgi:hypothetical protein
MPLSLIADIDQPVRVWPPWTILKPGVVSVALRVIGTTVRSAPVLGRNVICTPTKPEVFWGVQRI